MGDVIPGGGFCRGPFLPAGHPCRSAARSCPDVGFSIADATDLGAIGDGLGIGTVIWIVATTLVVSLVGGVLAAHLSGRRGHDAGLMHGVVVWAVALLVALIIDTMLVSAAIRGAAATAGHTAQAAMSLGGKVISGIRLTGEGVADLASSRYTEQVRAELREAAVSALSGAGAKGGASVSESDIREAIDNLDAEVIREAAQQVVAGNLDQAQATLRRAPKSAAKSCATRSPNSTSNSPRKSAARSCRVIWTAPARR